MLLDIPLIRTASWAVRLTRVELPSKLVLSKLLWIGSLLLACGGTVLQVVAILSKDHLAGLPEAIGTSRVEERLELVRLIASQILAPLSSVLLAAYGRRNKGVEVT